MANLTLMVKVKGKFKMVKMLSHPQGIKYFLKFEGQFYQVTSFQTYLRPLNKRFRFEGKISILINS